MVKRRSIRTKLISLLVVLTMAVTTVLSIIFSFLDYQNETANLKETIQKNILNQKDAIGLSIWRIDTVQLTQQIRGIKATDGVAYVKVESLDGAVNYIQGEPPSDILFSVRYPISAKVESNFDSKDLQVAWIEVVVAKSFIFQMIFYRALHNIMWDFIKVAIVLVIGSILIQRQLISKIERVHSFLENFALGKEIGENIKQFLSVRSGSDEIDELAQISWGLVSKVTIYQTELEIINRSLESKVRERTDEVIESRKRLEVGGRLAALGEMAGAIGHEINNPMAIIKGKAELLLKMIDHPEESQLSEEDKLARAAKIKKHVQAVIVTAERVAKIVRGLRFIARDGKGDPVEDVPLFKILEDVLDVSSEKVKHLAIDLRIDPRLDQCSIACRRVEISQTFLNLLTNAVQAVAEKNERWIEISLVDIADDSVTVRFADSGGGIPPELRDKIMQPFFTTKPVGEGTGLGLSISKAILENHGGKIELESSPTSTAFILVLPRAKNLMVIAA